MTTCKKILMAVIFAMVFLGCGEQPPPKAERTFQNGDRVIITIDDRKGVVEDYVWFYAVGDDELSWCYKVRFGDADGYAISYFREQDLVPRVPMGIKQKTATVDDQERTSSLRHVLYYVRIKIDGRRGHVISHTRDEDETWRYKIRFATADGYSTDMFEECEFEPWTEDKQKPY